MKKAVRTINGILILFAVSSFILGLFKIGLFFLAVAVMLAFITEVRKAGKNKTMQASAQGIPALRDYLKSRIVGQNKAIDEVVSTIKLKTKKQEVEGVMPVLGTFLFVGTTGTGKTETAKAIAEWFNAKYGHQFLSFDMGGFTDYHTASTLVGSPKGYIGSQEGGALTRPLMQNPKAVILFDEIEKAHPSLYKTFMRLIDEGLVQEVSTGIYVKLNQGIIIFTSNLFQGTIREISRSMLDDTEKELLIRDVLTGKVDKALEIVPREVVQQDINNAQGQPFPPEFIGRIDKIVVFKPLKELDLVEITARVMAKYGISQDMKRAYQITQKYKQIANEYGVRVFIKKVEEELLR